MISQSRYYQSPHNDFALFKGDCLEVIKELKDNSFEMVFADPPYFLSNGGISVQSGKVVCVDKGDWDKGKSLPEMDEFNRKWLSACYDKLKDNGTIWVSGTYHNIFSVGHVMTELGFKILNVVTWEKTDPAPHVVHSTFTHASEFIIWARKSSSKAKHTFNYELLKDLNSGRQMTDVWTMDAVQKWEKAEGKHPTQKPLPLLARIIHACTKEGDWILDPFAGSCTTGIASVLLERNFVGIEMFDKYLALGASRYKALLDEKVKRELKAEMQANVFTDSRETVLIARVRSKEQWDFINAEHIYNLPYNKVRYLSTNFKYILLYQEHNPSAARIFSLASPYGSICSKEELAAKSKAYGYEPRRDKEYAIYSLGEPMKGVDGDFRKDSLNLEDPRYNACWFRPLSEIIKCFLLAKPNNIFSD